MKPEQRADSLTTTEMDEPDEQVEELDLLEFLAAAHAERVLAEKGPRPTKIDGVVVGRVVASSGASVRVSHRHADSEAGDVARCLVLVTPGDVGREVALLFEGGSPDAPIVMGFMQETTPATATVRAAHAAVEADAERLVFAADKEIVLRCGDASITLTRAGKILIRGAYVSSRASNVNRIQGGSVEIN